ncbi:hypothetical protein GQ55_1G025700 [Panicum hallii var. hallii]|uniref:Uncharacterized protein n=2 Tax=Panicum hallii TaxID=206008 RepID=A0A2T7F1I3_9POAL|nr:hypothetical protein GQ55_1G025700 [Panicum hallii var. hallii]PVH65557.1 hypothetical protein PAHAL_1G025500 [Panicum hallii]
MKATAAANMRKGNRWIRKKEIMDLSCLFEKQRSGSEFSLDEGNSSCEYEVVIGNEHQATPSHQHRHRPC